MGQGGGACRTERRRQACRLGGDQTKKKRFPDRPKRVSPGDSAGGGNASMGERKKREILGLERGQHGGTGAGQGGLLESAPNWRGTRVYYLTHAKKAKPQKEEPTDRGEKKCF